MVYNNLKTKRMKSNLLVLSFFISTIYSFGQGMIDRGGFEGVFNQSAVLDISPIAKNLEKQREFYTEEQWKILMQKKYLTISYNPCYVDDYKALGYVRYNLADDQMEFLKDNQIYYLKKELGKTIRFTTLNTTYKIYEFNGRLDYYLVINEGKSSLLVKQQIKFVEPKEPKTSYDEYKPADFMRVKDEFYFTINNKDLVKIPRKKKAFFALFNEKSDDIETFANKNKLSYKSLDDLEKIVAYFNTL